MWEEIPKLTLIENIYFGTIVMYDWRLQLYTFPKKLSVKNDHPCVIWQT